MTKKHRIIYLVGAYPQWSETFVRQDLAFLQELGLPLLPLALCPGDAAREPDWPAVQYLESGGCVPPVGAGRGALARLLPRWLRTRLSLLRHRQRVDALARMAVSAGIEHIHAEFADLPALLAAAAARRLGLGYSVGVHARDVHLAKFSPSLIYGRARFVVACNRDAWLGVVRQSRASESRTHLIHHGLDLSAWRFREPATSQEPSPLRLLFVGRFVPKKGLAVLLRALGHLREDGIDARLSLFGSGPLEEPLRAMGAALDLGDALFWGGVVSRDEIARQMREHEILVMPSVMSREGDRDGIPNVVLEAMASGTPVVGSDGGSIPEVLDSSTGWIFPAGDDKALAEAVRQVRSSRGEALARSRAARQLVAERFDARVLARKRAALFRAVLS